MTDGPFLYATQRAPWRALWQARLRRTSKQALAAAFLPIGVHLAVDGRINWIEMSVQIAVLEAIVPIVVGNPLGDGAHTEAWRWAGRVARRLVFGGLATVALAVVMIAYGPSHPPAGVAGAVVGVAAMGGFAAIVGGQFWFASVPASRRRIRSVRPQPRIMIPLLAAGLLWLAWPAATVLIRDGTVDQARVVGVALSAAAMLLGVMSVLDCRT